MTVSGLGFTRTPRLPVTTPHRAPRAERTERTDFDHLTAADRELIFQATGRRVGRDSMNPFAAAIAAERAAGHLTTGQPVTGVYLKDLNRRYERAGGPNPLAPHLEKALDYLSRSGPKRIDVSA
ncbi:hypothetical protein ACQP2F_35465 [Actinoplanes sp. CA-030573]|uniref:hypothetical protein n=1 Tax=Actinoplanes sp. CA-030573 TaxID=3239898 RepID=UPI003D8C3F7C